MARSAPSFPFFLPTDPRALTDKEFAVLSRLLRDQPPNFQDQAAHLQVVGRCGCGNCPTVFFSAHEPGDREADLVTMAGKDRMGGLVAAVLLEKSGVLSQLEFYSVDGHEPWEVPDGETLAPW